MKTLATNNTAGLLQQLRTSGALAALLQLRVLTAVVLPEAPFERAGATLAPPLAGWLLGAARSGTAPHTAPGGPA